MSAQLILTVVGAAIGSVVPGVGTAWGAAIGSAVGGVIDYAMLPDTNNFGPRLDELKVTNSTYGSAKPYHFGTTRTAGNIIWSEDLHEVETRTEADDGKGGPTQTTITYAYFATFAVSLGFGVGRGVRRIWANGVLVWDATLGAANPDAVALDFTFYPGTPDQLPDPTMEASIGVGMVPGYRDEIIVVFREAPLEKFGNRIPSFEMELIMEGEWGVTDLALQGSASEDVYRLAVQALDGSVVAISRVDTSNIVLTSFDPTTGATLATAPYAMALGASALYVPPTNEVWIAGSGSGSGYERFNATTLEHVGSVAGVDGFYHAGPIYYDRVLRQVTGLSGISAFFGASFIEYEVGGTLLHNFGTVTFCDQLTSGGSAVAVGTLNTGGFAVYKTNPLFTPEIFETESSPGVPASYENPQIGFVTAPGAKGAVFDPTRNRYVGIADSIWTIADSITLTATEYTPAGYDPGNVTGFQYVGGLDVIEVFGTGITTTQVTVLDAGTFEVLYEGGIGSVLSGYSVIKPFSNSQMLPGTVFMIGATQPWSVNLYGTTYAAAVSALSLASDVIEAGDIDVSELGQRLNGYSVAQPGPVRSAIEQLARADLFEGVEVDGKLYFRRRGGATVATITRDQCGAGIDKAMEHAITSTRAQELDLPAHLYVTASDPHTDYQPGTQYAERLAQDAGSDETEQYAIVLSATETKRLADARLFDRWASRESGSISVGRRYARIVPTDPIVLDGRRVRVMSRSDEGGVIRFDWVADDAEVIQQLALGAQGSFTPQTVPVQVPTSLIILDIALLREVDEGPGAYVAAWGVEPYWRGMSLFMSADGGISYSPQVTLGAPGSAVGIATTALGAWAGDNTFDETNRLTVQMRRGAPSGTTRLAVLNGSNAAAVEGVSGWEVIQYRDVTLNGDGTYTLSGLLRGRCGTEWAMAGHFAGQRVVLLTSGSVRNMAMDSSALGLARQYKPVTVGDTLGATLVQTATVNGERLECLSPVHLGGGINDNDDHVLTWMRRTRYGGAWRDAVDVPLGETTEAYEVDIFDGEDVVRTLSVSAPTATYTAAQQTSDFGELQLSIAWAVFQLSSVVGRGHPAYYGVSAPSPTPPPPPPPPGETSWLGVSDAQFDAIDDAAATIGDTLAPTARAKIAAIPTSGYALSAGGDLRAAVEAHDVVIVAPGHYVVTSGSWMDWTGKTVVGAAGGVITIDLSLITDDARSCSVKTENSVIVNLRFYDAESCTISDFGGTFGMYILSSRPGHQLPKAADGHGLTAAGSDSMWISCDFNYGMSHAAGDYDVGNYGVSHGGSDADGIDHRDGVGVYIDVGTSYNADDGFDTWEAPGAAYCYFPRSVGNGFNPYFTGALQQGDGNGYKLGSGDCKHYLWWPTATGNRAYAVSYNANLQNPSVHSPTFSGNGEGSYAYGEDLSHYDIS